MRRCRVRLADRGNVFPQYLQPYLSIFPPVLLRDELPLLPDDGWCRLGMELGGIPNAALAKWGDNIALSVFCTSIAFAGGFTEVGAINEPDETGFSKGERLFEDTGLA